MRRYLSTFVPLSLQDGIRHADRMVQVTATTPPRGSLIAPFAEMSGYYADAFAADAARHVELAEVISAFYTTPLFRAERSLLKLAGIRSSDAELAHLSDGTGERFAAWTVEARREDEVLLRDVAGRTKSWLKVEPGDGVSRVFFGSVVVPVEKDGHLTLGPVFQLLLGAHRRYSRMLLSAAVRRLDRNR